MNPVLCDFELRVADLASEWDCIKLTYPKALVSFSEKETAAIVRITVKPVLQVVILLICRLSITTRDFKCPNAQVRSSWYAIYVLTQILLYLVTWHEHDALPFLIGP